MKYILALLITVSFAHAQSQSQIQKWVMESVAEMPSAGGYELTAKAPQVLRDAFSFGAEDELRMSLKAVTPSYCTTATYFVFYRVLQKYWTFSGAKPSLSTLNFLKPNLEKDGLRSWGRWNSNGPGTSKYFHDAQIGQNFEDISKARTGDFLKLFWNGLVGKNERGHSVIFLAQETQKGVPGLWFWGSSSSTKGYGRKWIPLTDAKKMIFTRLTNPENFENIGRLQENDDFLESMLTTEYSWAQVQAVTGM